MFIRRLYDLRRLTRPLTEAETTELKELEEFDAKLRKEADEGWRRRMDSRTPEEVARGVVAPG